MDRRKVRKQDAANEDSNGSPQPPQSTSDAQRTLKQVQQEHAKGRTDYKAYDCSDNQILECLIGLTEAMWKHEPAVVAEGQVNDRVNTAEDGDKQRQQ